MDPSSEPAPAPDAEDSDDDDELKSSVQNRKPKGKGPRPKKGFGGLPCLAIKDDGKVCRTIISSYTPEITYQACTNCLNRSAFRGCKRPRLAAYDPVTRIITPPSRKA